MSQTPSTLSWPEIARRMALSPIYWVHTTAPSGAPEASPVWGVVVDEHLYFYTARSTVKAKNLARDPRVLVHLESGTNVVMVHGDAQDLGHPYLSPQVVGAFEVKYHRPDERPFLPSSDPSFDVLYRFEPRRALTWSLPDTEASTQRWTAPARTGWRAPDGEHQTAEPRGQV